MHQNVINTVNANNNKNERATKSFNIKRTKNERASDNTNTKKNRTDLKSGTEVKNTTDANDVKRIIIVGDSMLKHVNGWKLRICCLIKVKSM